MYVYLFTFVFVVLQYLYPYGNNDMVITHLQTASAVGTVDEGEEVGERMKAISDVLKTNVSKEDRASFQFLLREHQQQKTALQKKKLGNLLAKYGHASSSHFSGASSLVTQPEVINVGSPSSQPSISAKAASASPSPSPSPRR